MATGDGGVREEQREKKAGRRMNLTRGVAKALVVLAVGASGSVQACSCVKRDAARMFEDADRLVVARVTRVQYQRAWIGEARIWGEVQILDTLKESAGLPLTKVWSEREIPACGLPLIVGQVYLFAPGGMDEMQVDHCASWAIGAGNVEGERVLRQMQLIREERRRRAMASLKPAAPAASAARR